MSVKLRLCFSHSAKTPAAFWLQGKLKPSPRVRSHSRTSLWGFGERQRPEQHATHHGKQRGVYTDAESNNHDGGQRESWRPAESASSVLQIARKGIEPGEGVVPPELFAHLLGIAELESSGAPCF